MIPNSRQVNLRNLLQNGTFNHNTSSPYHAQSNGKAENAVKKRLFTKAKKAGISEAQALLDFRNTLSEGNWVKPGTKVDGSSLQDIARDNTWSSSKTTEYF